MPKSFARSLEEIQSSKTWSAAVMPAGRLVAKSATTAAFQVKYSSYQSSSDWSTKITWNDNYYFLLQTEEGNKIMCSIIL